MGEVRPWIFDRVVTPDGVGTVVSVTASVDNSGIYIERAYPPIVTYLVWYGTDQSASGWIRRKYAASDVRVATPAAAEGGGR